MKSALATDIKYSEEDRKAEITTLKKRQEMFWEEAKKYGKTTSDLEEERKRQNDIIMNCRQKIGNHPEISRAIEKIKDINRILHELSGISRRLYELKQNDSIKTNPNEASHLIKSEPREVG